MVWYVEVVWCGMLKWCGGTLVRKSTFGMWQCCGRLVVEWLFKKLEKTFGVAKIRVKLIAHCEMEIGEEWKNVVMKTDN